jgi:hypothetical protein
VPTAGSPKVPTSQAIEPVTPVRETQRVSAPNHTVAVLPAGSVQVWPSAPQAVAAAGGVGPDGGGVTPVPVSGGA